MTVYLETRIHRYVGESGDTKPADETLPGSLFYETDTGNWFVWDGSDWVSYSYPYSLETARSQFIANLLAITGDTRLLWLPAGSDGLTSIDQSLTGRTLTHNVTVQDRLERLGLGYQVSFDGVSEFVTTPDAANLSFDGTTDQAFSIIVLANVINSAAERVLVSKSPSAANSEYYMAIDANDKLVLLVRDPSQSAQCFRTSTPAINQGQFALFGASYDGSGDNAGNGMTLYQNGALMTSTATNNQGGTYVDMENGTSPVEVGSRTAGAASRLAGAVALVVICQKNLSASEHWALFQLCQGYFDFLA